MKRGKKLHGNGMWEASRMMLPEHRQAILQHRNEWKRKEKPLLDEQRLDELSRQIVEAMQTNSVVRVEIYHPYRMQEVTGQITMLDTLNSRIELKNQKEAVWVSLSEILDVAIRK